MENANKERKPYCTECKRCQKTLYTYNFDDLEKGITCEKCEEDLWERELDEDLGSWI